MDRVGFAADVFDLYTADPDIQRVAPCFIFSSE